MPFLHQDKSLDVDTGLECKYRFTLTNQDDVEIGINSGDVLSLLVGKPNSEALFVLTETESDEGVIEVVELGEDQVTSAVVDVTIYGDGTIQLSPNDVYVADLILLDAITLRSARIHRLALSTVDRVLPPEES